MAQFRVDNFSFKYPNTNKYALKDISFNVEQGEFVLICGQSGSGKTTLLRNLNPNLLPAGDTRGEVVYDNDKINNLEPKRMVTEIGMVFQAPDMQIVMDKVSDEIAFSLENIAMSSEKIRLRLAELSTYFGLENIIDNKINTLSGGQKQIVNLNSVLALKPKVLIFDEPTSRLDPVASKEFINLVKQLNEQHGITVIISEHRIDDLIEFATKVILLDQGEVKYINTNQNFANEIYSNDLYNKFLPKVSIIKDLTKDKLIPLTVKQARKQVNKSSLVDIKFRDDLDSKGKLLIKMKDLSFSYDINEGYILKDINLELFEGEFIACLGANATGKSTLLKCMSGILKPLSGKIYFQNKRIKKPTEFSEVGYVAQNPLLHFSYDSVKEELDNLSGDNKYTYDLVELFNLDDFLSHHPYDLSGGQQQKLAIIMALANKPKLLLLDEPTKGLDPIAKDVLANHLKELNKSGLSILCATHDLDFAAEHMRKSIMLFNKDICYSGSTRELLSHNSYYTTDISLVFKTKNSKCISSQDVREWIRLNSIGS